MEKILDIKTFANEIKRMLLWMHPSMDIRIEENVKNNGEPRVSVFILSEGSNAAPVIYLEDLFDRYTSGMPLEKVCEIVMEYAQDVFLPENAINDIMEFFKCKGRICYKLINAERNGIQLKACPHRLYHDLAIVYYVLVGDIASGFLSVKVTNEIMAMWDVDENELYETARQNTPKLLKIEISSITKILSDLIKKNSQFGMEDVAEALKDEASHGGLPFYVVTNEQKCNGAVAMLYDGVLENFAKMIEDDFYILPSSVNEVMFLPASMPSSEGESGLLGMVRAINASEVAPDEFLSDNIYRYFAKENCVELIGQK